MKDPRQVVTDIVTRIVPIDEKEAEHRQATLEWIESDAPIFRISKPDNPFQHLVSHFLLFDQPRSSIMLIDHKKAGLWLPPGGHVDIDEDPQYTVIREAEEELKLNVSFDTPFGPQPLFITRTTTRGQGNHTDVSLWYVVSGDSKDDLWFDAREMNGYRWLTLDEVLAIDIANLDPHLHRFVKKMQYHLA